MPFKKGEGWPKGRARSLPSVGTKRCSIMFSREDLDVIKKLMERWRCKRPEAIRRALRVALETEATP